MKSGYHLDKISIDQNKIWVKGHGWHFCSRRCKIEYNILIWDVNRIKWRNLLKMILPSLCETIYARQIENSANGCTCKVNYREIQSSVSRLYNFCIIYENLLISAHYSFHHQEESAKLGKNASTCIIIIIIIDHMGS